jgi:hypothetical protein
MAVPGTGAGPFTKIYRPPLWHLLRPFGRGATIARDQSTGWNDQLDGAA